MLAGVFAVAMVTSSLVAVSGLWQTVGAFKKFRF